VKHVFVETNFVVDVARPFPSPDAEQLMARANAGGDVTLHIPWVAIAEAKRTLDRIIREDLGFTDAMGQFVVREFRDAKIDGADKKVIDALSKRAAAARKAAIQAIAATVDAVAARATIVEPSKSVVTKVLSLFAVKSLKPFDEMVLGAVLTKASELYQAGERDLWFCNLNKRDFDPANQPALAAEYAASALQFRASFAIPK
jgi:hypothetical protein